MGSQVNDYYNWDKAARQNDICLYALFHDKYLRFTVKTNISSLMHHLHTRALSVAVVEVPVAFLNIKRISIFIFRKNFFALHSKERDFQSEILTL